MSASSAGSGVLASRLDTILMAVESLLRSRPANDITGLAPERELHELGFRIFRLGLAFIEAMDAGQLRAEWLRETLPDAMGESRTLANYGALVRGRVAGWFEGTEAAAFARTIDAQGASHSGLDLLQHIIERATQDLQDLYTRAGRD
jgi:hypothetical protein